MTTKGTTTERAMRENLAPINRLGSVSWIPAFAGMTAGAGITVKGTTTKRAIRENSAPVNRLGLVSSAACSRRGSTTYIPVGVSINDDGRRD